MRCDPSAFPKLLAALHSQKEAPKVSRRNPSRVTFELHKKELAQLVLNPPTTMCPFDREVSDGVETTINFMSVCVVPKKAALQVELLQTDINA
jgi:hypothetical protein